MARKVKEKVPYPLRECRWDGNMFIPKRHNEWYCCEDCRKASISDSARRSMEKKRRLVAEKERTKHQVGKTLAEINAEASACGMSYGMYRAKLDREKGLT